MFQKARITMGLLAGLCLAGLCTGLVQVASASKTTYGSKIWMIYVPQISPTLDSFEGQVTSRQQSCVEDRKVTVFRKRSGKDAVLGSSKSTDEGYWFVHVPPARSGAYYAEVKKRSIGTKKHERICKSAVSASVEVPGTLQAEASAVATEVKVGVDWSEGYPIVTAKIKSKQKKCVAPRELSFERANGEQYYVGSTNTGVWPVHLIEYPAYPPRGTYYIEASKRTVKTKDGRIRCAADRSKPIDLN